MPDVIDLSNRRANMAYVGETPWHGLGQSLTVGQPIEVWVEEAGMDWTVERSRVVYRWGEERGQVRAIENQHVLWRSDTKLDLGIVSNRFQPVQPRETLEFYRNLLVAEGGNYQLETAGCLEGGRKLWSMARAAEPVSVGNDKVYPYLLFVTANDGTMATRVYHTSVRVVCMNTLQMSFGDQDTGVSVRHSTRFDADVVKAQLGLTRDYVAEFAAMVEDLASKRVSMDTAAEVVTEVYGVRDAQGNVTNEDHLSRVATKIAAIMRTGPGADLSTARNSAWGVLNAITRFEDFEARARSNENRFRSSQFGEGAKRKAEATRLLLAA